MVGQKLSPYKNTNDEMFGMFFKKKLPREHCKSYWSWFLEQSSSDLKSANAEAELLFKKFGITFTMHALMTVARRQRLIGPFLSISYLEFYQKQSGAFSSVDYCNVH